MKKSADLILEEINLDRNVKKNLIDDGITLYEEAR